MALNAYLSSVQRLLHDTSGIYSVSDLTIYINTARDQIALESECIRVLPANNTTSVGQEVYTFASVNALIKATYPGVNGINSVKSVAVSWGTYKPVLDHKVWSDFQAYLRSYSNLIQNYPEVWSQYAQGASGSVYLWPIPSQITSMDWDCICSPLDLIQDADPEAIPYPWSSTIPYFAAFLALLNAQRPTQADEMLKRYDFFMKRARASVDSTFTPSFY